MNYTNLKNVNFDLAECLRKPGLHIVCHLDYCRFCIFARCCLYSLAYLITGPLLSMLASVSVKCFLLDVVAKGKVFVFISLKTQDKVIIVSVMCRIIFHVENIL